MRTTTLRLLVLSLVAASVGCSEETLVRSTPPGAAVYWGDREIGTTPTPFVVKRAEWRDDFTLRLEHDGYQPATVIVPTHIAKGRVTGGIFTLGLVWLFKRPTTLPDRVDVPLTPAHVGEAPADAPADARLQVLQRLLDQHLITDEEFRARRDAIMNGL